MMMNLLVVCLAFLAGNFRFVACQQMNYSCAVKQSQVNTAEKLSQLRARMRSLSLYAYVIFFEDEHQSEYVQQYDTRQAWITGFLGSTGSAVVTLDQAALWIDNRYRTQAENELDCANWLLMRQDEPGVPTLGDWIASQLKATSSYNNVGVAAQFTSSDYWSSMEHVAALQSVPLVKVAELIDPIRLADRSMTSSNPVFVHNIMFAGISWEKKVEIIAELINTESTDGLLVTALDEIAWLFNVRGSDIPYSPFFKAYAFVHANQTTRLWMNESQLTSDARTQLRNVIIQPYEEFLTDLYKLANNSDMNRIWITPSVSQAISDSIPTNKRLIAGSPVARTKAVKNPTEQKGMRDCSVRDSIARVRHLAWLENEIKNNRQVNETQAAERLEYYQSLEAHFKEISFPTISAVGAHAATIHFEPDAETAAEITRDKVYLLDAGAQYLDGTTDVTRTHTFGTPTAEEKKAYTLVLQGSIDLADAVFPVGTYGRQLDILARQSLYKNFMDYAHSTGHDLSQSKAIRFAILTPYHTEYQPM
ncbi:unnamed protein product [Rotaria sp. Silwood1]|nr:unnamed protein product [Rotaria sp. Silwood1]CAF3517760.1 unnamed protein product [Rotaria sp. Silwood1]CAF4677512.1 unnamed protein product [Rotaria sp. Silwood1]